MSKSRDGPFSRVEVIVLVQRRRRWHTAEKVRLVEESMRPGLSVSFVERQAGISPSQLFTWKRCMLEGGRAALQADEDVVGTSRVRDLEKRVRNLSGCSRADQPLFDLPGGVLALSGQVVLEAVQPRLCRFGMSSSGDALRRWC